MAFICKRKKDLPCGLEPRGEIFRVFAAQHPGVNLTPIRVADDVRKMIERARAVEANAALDKPPNE
jgi:hypothetical protein